MTKPLSGDASFELHAELAGFARADTLSWMEPIDQPRHSKASSRRGTWLVIGMITFALLLAAMALRYRHFPAPAPPAGGLTDQGR